MVQGFGLRKKVLFFLFFKKKIGTRSDRGFRSGAAYYTLNLCQLLAQPGTRCVVLSVKVPANACWSITCVREDMILCLGHLYICFKEVRKPRQTHDILRMYRECQNVRVKNKNKNTQYGNNCIAKLY